LKGKYMSIEILGFSDPDEFRENNQYKKSEKSFNGLSDNDGNETPPLCVNIAHLSTMESLHGLKEEFGGKSLRVAILGISSARGPKDLQDLLKSLGVNHVSTIALDLSDGVFAEIETSNLDEVHCLIGDARNTGLLDCNQDLVLRDHLGNCCPPNIDRAINFEVNRIVKPGGISIVNITTSDFLTKSKGRVFVSFRLLAKNFGPNLIQALKDQIYDLEGLMDLFPNIDPNMLRGSLLEIEPNRSFVVFGEDKQGHGEWFRSLEDHLFAWQQTGFEILEIKSREGFDSHNPPLKCKRHNVVLKKLA
jgi:hypothetical protein